MPSIQQAWSRHKFTITQATNVVAAYLNPDRPAGTFPWEKEGLVATPCLIGEAGIGKTSIVRQIARRFKMEYRDSQVGARAFEDVLGIPSREEDPNHPGHHKMLAPPSFPVERPLRGPHVRIPNGDGVEWRAPKDAEALLGRKPKKEEVVDFCGYGVYFHDELMTADPDKQNQIRDMVENRRVGVLDMADGWFQVAATNPPTKGFVTVKRMDKAVEDRLVYVPMEPTFEEVMGFWELNQMVPEVLFKFLLWREGAGFQGTKEDTIGSRRWVMIGDMIDNMEREGADEDVVFDAIASNLTAEHAKAFKDFRKFGNDPTKYPLRAKDFFDPERAQQAIEIMKAWKKNGRHALAGASILALRAWIVAAKNDDKLDLTDENLDTVAKLISNEVINLEHSQSLMNILGNTKYGPAVVEHMYKNNVAVSLMEKLAQASDIVQGRMKKRK